jgi:hypothetical protein
MEYASPQALRQAIDARLVNESRAVGVPADRLRRRMVFERLLARLEAAEPGQWVLKGGMALEMRWREIARSTKDLDVASRPRGGTPSPLGERLREALATDPDGDGFGFEIRDVRAISADVAGRPGWRASVHSKLAGRTFAQITLDVVERTEEIVFTERMRMPGSLAFAGIEAREVEAVSLPQHFAEKIHALTRTYGGERPSSRVRDLVDLVLLIEQGPPDPAQTARAVRGVFAARNTHPVPGSIGDPPASWGDIYAAMASELDLAAATVEQAMKALRGYWAIVDDEEDR